MKTNKKYYKQKKSKKYGNKRKLKQRQTKRNGGMLRKIASPVAKGVITIGTEYGKDQAQKIFRDKPNVLKDITNDRSILSPNIKNIYNNNDSNNLENVTPNLVKKYLNKPIKLLENDENNEL